MKFLLILFFITSVVFAQQQPGKASNSYYGDKCLYGNIDLSQLEEGILKPIGNATLIQHFASTNTYIIDWMEDTNNVTMRLVMNDEMSDQNLYVDDYSKIAFYVDNKIESEGKLTLTTVKRNDINGKITNSIFVFENLKK